MSWTDVALDPPPDENVAALTGVDALGSWLDSGISCLPTTRPSIEQDIHSAVPSLSAFEARHGREHHERAEAAPGIAFGHDGAEVILATDLDTDQRLAERLDRVEEAITVLAERFGSGRVLNNTAVRELMTEARERMRNREIDSTPLIQYTGTTESFERVREFCGSDASVNQEPNSAVLKLIWQGHEDFVRPGRWLAKDLATGRVCLTQPPEP